jgi:diaminopimelate epimerase
VTLEFSKYQGTGNDFIMVVDLDDQRALAPDQVASLCDRRTGVGADGVIRVVRADGVGAPVFMDYSNADGSVAEMCGNGIRCVGRLVHDRGIVDGLEFAVRTRAGVRRLALHPDEHGTIDEVTVGMGPPNLTKAGIPMRGPAWETFLQQPFDLGNGLTVAASAVSMGNPHVVLFLEDDPDRVHVSHIGPAVEHDELFPEGTNVEFAQVRTDGIKARVWERGSGETMGCGSGACAVAVAAQEAGLSPATVGVRFPGGAVTVERTSDDVLLTGGVEHVFDGAIDLHGRR